MTAIRHSWPSPAVEYRQCLRDHCWEVGRAWEAWMRNLCGTVLLLTGVLPVVTLMGVLILMRKGETYVLWRSYLMKLWTRTAALVQGRD